MFFVIKQDGISKKLRKFTGLSQLAITYSKLTFERQEQDMKYL